MAKFKRVAEAFDEAAAKARRLRCGDQDSPPETAVDLSDLVKSFMEESEGNFFNGSDQSDGDCGDWELRDELSVLLGCGGEVKRNIREEVEKACRGVGNGVHSPGFKRRVVARLRDRGFDAGESLSPYLFSILLTA